MRFIHVLFAGAMLAGCSNELKVTEVEPSAGTAGGGEEITIRGGGFQMGHGVQVKFGKKEASGVVIESADKIKVTTPAGDKNTITDISVVFDDGKSFLLKNGFKYLDTTQQREMMDKAFNAMGTKK